MHSPTIPYAIIVGILHQLTQRLFCNPVVRCCVHIPSGGLVSNNWVAEPGIHYNDVIMNAKASQITSLTIVYSSVYSDADQRKHQSSASLAFISGTHRWPVNSPHKGSGTQKIFPFDDVIMTCFYVDLWKVRPACICTVYIDVFFAVLEDGVAFYGARPSADTMLITKPWFLQDLF